MSIPTNTTLNLTIAPFAPGEQGSREIVTSLDEHRQRYDLRADALFGRGQQSCAFHEWRV
jgi:hypothetical protein